MNNKIKEHLPRIIFDIIIIAAAILVAWSTLQGDVNSHTKDLAKHDVRIAACEQTGNDLKTKIEVVITNQSYMQKSVDRIEKKIDGY